MDKALEKKKILEEKEKRRIQKQNEKITYMPKINKNNEYKTNKSFLERQKSYEKKMKEKKDKMKEEKK